ncbi:MAG: hypothetical protein HFF62_15750 [Oscillospiraceae bacterium]|nr:hypothetical protein [Oscillospiraceae bacterium]
MTLNEVAGAVAPAYIFLNGRFDKNVEDMLQAFRSSYANMNLGYSYKTNYTPYACKSVDRHGGYAEVVSPMEYDYALSLGVDPSRIIFNGVCKTVEAIRKAILGGSIINADSSADFRNIVRESGRVGKMPRVGIRMNFDIGIGYGSRFGVDPDEDEFREIMAAAKANGIRISGLHCHLSYTRSVESFRRRANGLIEIAGMFDSLDYLDLGGKLFGRMSPEFAKQFPEVTPAFEDYGSAVGAIFKKAFPDESVELIVEPGTALVSDCMNMATRVMYLKEIGGDIYAGVDASQYDLGFAGEFKSPPYRVLNTSDNGKEICCSIVGCTCVETDVLTNEHWGRIQEGDVVLYENVGAYTCNLSRLFIKPCLPVVEYDGESYTEVKPALSLAY